MVACQPCCMWVEGDRGVGVILVAQCYYLKSTYVAPFDMFGDRVCCLIFIVRISLLDWPGCFISIRQVFSTSGISHWTCGFIECITFQEWPLCSTCRNPWEWNKTATSLEEVVLVNGFLSDELESKHSAHNWRANQSHGNQASLEINCDYTKAWISKKYSHRASASSSPSSSDHHQAEQPPRDCWWCYGGNQSGTTPSCRPVNSHCS